MSEVIFGRNVKHLEADWYPSVPGVRLMDDGTGRQADVECHPDPDVEMVCWTICEAEVLQGIGRPRGVRRGPSNPVLVFVLNKLDLGDIPISELITWDDLSGHCGPLMIMASQGCIPKMWADVAHMIGWWDKAADPAANARAWFRDHPAEQALLDGLRKAGRINHPLTGTEMKFRRESLGMVGKNHRYAWLADGTTTDDARAILSPRPASDPGA